MGYAELTPAAIRFTAMNMLAMREHSAAELEKKLRQKYCYSGDASPENAFESKEHESKERQSKERQSKENSSTELSLSVDLNSEALRNNPKIFNCFDCIAAVIATLTAEGLQSDLRFTEAFIVMRQRQGKGPLLIRLELKERGISSDIIVAAVNPMADEWNILATKVNSKKFGFQQAYAVKQQAKQIRFLTARGFSSANIQHALKSITLAGE
jgi:regulatory protein